MSHGLQQVAVPGKPFFLLVDPMGFFFKKALELIDIGSGKPLKQLHVTIA